VVDPEPILVVSGADLARHVREMKVALVHAWLANTGGAESVIWALYEL
jgi:ethanolamine utilization protein EutP (predicted NTPase)